MTTTHGESETGILRCFGQNDRRLDHLHRGRRAAQRLAEEDLPHAAVPDPSQKFEVAQHGRILGVQGRDPHGVLGNRSWASV
ncbi:hypothetical protein [Streptomyces prasinosporus]|uniref:hypothetical protein n=1 Tax=Streptomyces prasinosporus TaxID=68256 RepID=UPI0031E7A905